jgi:hypothetical protein
MKQASNDKHLQANVDDLAAVNALVGTLDERIHAT